MIWVEEVLLFALNNQKPSLNYKAFLISEIGVSIVAVVSDITTAPSGNSGISQTWFWSQNQVYTQPLTRNTLCKRESVISTFPYARRTA